MKFIVSTFLIGVIATPGIAVAQSTNNSGNVGNYSINSRVTCVNPPVSAYEILAERWPSVDVNPAMPDACKRQAQTMAEGWRREDEQNINSLINRYCSYRSGWAEFVPGTCQAGGPPPICTANHWFRDPNTANKQHNDELEKVLNDRAKKLRESTCDCWGRSLNSEFESQNNNILRALSSQADLQKSTGDELKLPCLDIPGKSPCPDGYKCVNGWCVSQTEGQKNLEKLKSYAFEKIFDYGKDKLKEVIGDFSSTLGQAFKVFSSPWARAGAEGFAPSAVSTNIDGYRSSSGRLRNDMSNFYSLLVELNNFYHNISPARNKSLIVDDLNTVKAAMNDDYILMDQFFRGISIEKELFDCKDCCQSAFEAFHKELGSYYSIFNSVGY